MISPSFQIGKITVHWYGVIIAVAVFAGFQLAKARAREYKIPQSIFEDYILIVPLLAGIIFARLYHVFSSFSYYFYRPKEIFLINNGGLGILGGLFGIFLGVLFISRVKKLNFLKILDLIAPSVILGQAIGRFGNFVNQEGFGPPTNVFWKVAIDEAHRPLQYIKFKYFHPTFFYEMVLDLAGFGLLLFCTKKFRSDGQIFGLYLIVYGASRLIVEHFRVDTWKIGTFKVAYLVVVIMISLGLYFVSRQNFTKK